MFNSRTYKLVEKHIKDEDIRYDKLHKKIEEKQCPHDETISLMKIHNEEQNGHMLDLANQSKALLKTVNENGNNITKVLGIAEGRKSVWKDIGILTGVLGLVALIIFGIIEATK